MSSGRQGGWDAGKEWGTVGGRPRNECEIGSAPALAQKGLVGPDKWEPQVGHQLHAVRYIREQLRTMRLGEFTKEEGAEEEWEEPEVNDVEEQMWTEIRKKGFCGSKVRNRDLRRIWCRRDSITKHVELLELGKAGGVHHKRKRTTGAMRQACLGGGQRCVVETVSEALSAHEGGEEQGEEKGGTVQVLRRARVTALKPIFDEINITFGKWRMGGQYVGGEEFYKHSVSSKAKKTGFYEQ